MPNNDNVDLTYAFGLKPEKAIEYFKSKGYAFSWDWWEIWQEAHAQAFTVAKVMRMDILMDIREALQKALSEGWTLNRFQKELTPVLQAKGWWGKQIVGDGEGAVPVQLGSPYRLATIYRTNMQSSYMAGRWQEQQDNRENQPYLQYVAVMDARTRPSHAALNGKVFPVNDPFWQSFYPPNGWNCRCRVRALSEQNVGDRKLTVSSSEGTLSMEDRLISGQTGEMKPVTVYTDPRTGVKIAPDPGFSYNPGETTWQPDLSKYPPPLINQFQKMKS